MRRQPAILVDDDDSRQFGIAGRTRNVPLHRTGRARKGYSGRRQPLVARRHDLAERAIGLQQRQGGQRRGGAAGDPGCLLEKEPAVEMTMGEIVVKRDDFLVHACPLRPQLCRRQEIWIFASGKAGASVITQS